MAREISGNKKTNRYSKARLLKKDNTLTDKNPTETRGDYKSLASLPHKTPNFKTLPIFKT